MALMKDDTLTPEERATKATFYHTVCCSLACMLWQ
jgi:hypothetical protein